MIMSLLNLQIELLDPYDVAGRTLDIARRMGFQLVHLRLDSIGHGQHRMNLSLLPHANPDWSRCLFARLENTPGVAKVSLGPADYPE